MLNRYPPEEIVPALTHHNGRVRGYAAMMLGIDGQEQLVNFLVDLLQSESAPARRAAARALGISIRPLPDPGRAVGPGPAAVDRLALEGGASVCFRTVWHQPEPQQLPELASPAGVCLQASQEAAAQG